MKTTSVRVGGVSALGIIFLPLALLARTNGGFQNGGGIPCIWREITGYPCPACGLTRAFSSLSTFDFLAAFRFNSFVYLFLGAALMAAIYPQGALSISTRISSKLSGRSALSLALIAASLTAIIWALNILRVSTGLYPQS